MLRIFHFGGFIEEMIIVLQSSDDSQHLCSSFKKYIYYPSLNMQFKKPPELDFHSLFNKQICLLFVQQRFFSKEMKCCKHKKVYTVRRTLNKWNHLNSTSIETWACIFVQLGNNQTKWCQRVTWVTLWVHQMVVVANLRYGF